MFNWFFFRRNSCLYANIFRKGEYIKPHDHGNATISGNLFIDGSEDSETCYEEHGAIKNKIDDSRVVLLKQNFIYLEQNLKYLKISKVDGILADLGVSSFQLDSIDRGFSFERDSNLDMRMNQKSSPDAIEILNNYSESDLANMFFNYSDLTNSRKIAKIIVEKRNRKKIKSSNNLNEILSIFINHGYENKFLARVYQAIRIEVNQEIKNVKKMLVKAKNILEDVSQKEVLGFRAPYFAIKKDTPEQYQIIEEL